jgi:hypothetical protein
MAAQLSRESAPGHWVIVGELTVRGQMRRLGAARLDCHRLTTIGTRSEPRLSRRPPSWTV